VQSLVIIKHIMKHIIKEVLLQEAKKKKADDRCTRIAKRKYDVWPSAYASGAVVKCRQGKIWKNEELEYDLDSLIESEPQKLFDEKWSKDYKKSINCNNPKGFSQKAHCDARKKRQKGEETKSKSPFKEEFLNEKAKRDFSKEKEQGLHGWFARRGGKGKSKGWVDCNTCRDGKCKSCGRQEGEERSKYPRCRPTPAQCKGYKRPDQR
jgi:hypothetical protein